MRDRYTITERLAAGGQAEVFRGVAEGLAGFRKSVAIKRVLPDLGRDQKFVAMFLDEARLSLFLQHANIVHVFDISKAPDDAYFLVMEFVDGCDVKAFLRWHDERGRRVDLAQAIYVMIECCKALEYAHHLEHPTTGEPLHIVHRDVSPANILLSKMGEVKLVDFGLAKATSQRESTDPGVVKGKFGYLSPEAAWGQPVDHRTDLFAVGIILWEMMTGRRLFYGETDWATIELVREARMPSISAVNPQVDAELESIVRKALARDPADRYQTAAELGDALAMHLYSRRMKVTANDLARAVREVQREVVEARRAAAGGAAGLGAIDDAVVGEVAAATSLFDGSAAAGSAADEGGLVDTQGWIRGLGLDED
jgi:eukaryotic-like serine/threonine-protein kinase